MSERERPSTWMVRSTSIVLVVVVIVIVVVVLYNICSEDITIQCDVYRGTVLRGRGSGLNVGGFEGAFANGESTVNSPIQCSYHLPHSDQATHNRPSDVPCLTGKLNRYFTVSYPHSQLPPAARVRPQRGGKASSYPPIALARTAGNSQVSLSLSLFLCIYHFTYIHYSHTWS